MKKYDFIIFEISKYPNHYKDLDIIAELLMYGGYSVAIYNYFGEKDNCKVSNVPFIEPIRRHPTPSVMSKSGFPLFGIIGHLIDRIRISHYQKVVAKDLDGKCNNVYAGTYCDEISVSFIKNMPESVNFYLWVVRSSLLTQKVKLKFDWGSLNYLRIQKKVLDSGMRFFVSNHIIKQEFIDHGISPYRLVLRPERYIKTIIDNSTNSNVFTLLVIGSLRPDKRVELILSAISNMKNPTIKIIVAGRVQNDPSYAETIINHGKNIPGFERRDYRLSDEEYKTRLDSCDFLIMADKQQLSTITNGTMSEALIHYLPIIAPDYNPYRYYIDKYGIGVSYNPNEEGDLIRAIKEAKNKGKRKYHENITNYLNTITFENCSNLFCSEIKSALCQK